MRFLKYIALSAMVGSMMTACGEDEMPPDTVVCTTHNCGDALLPDGGEIRFENFLLPNGQPYAQAMATFYKSQSPERSTFPTRGSCQVFTETQLLPWAVDEPAPQQPAAYVVQREDDDAGSKITFVTTLGDTIEFPKINDGLDYMGRHHDIYYMDPVTAPSMMNPYGGSLDVAKLGGTTLNTQFSIQVTIEGSASIPAVTYSGQIGQPKPGIVVPNRGNFKINDQYFLATTANTNPPCDPMNPMAPPPPFCCDSAVQTCTGPAFIQIQRDQDLTITWDKTDDQVLWEDQTAVFGWGSMAGPFMICVADASAGSFTVSKEDIAKLPEFGTLFPGFNVHQFNNINGKRIDMLGTSCAGTYFQKSPPPM